MSSMRLDRRPGDVQSNRQRHRARRGDGRDIGHRDGRGDIRFVARAMESEGFRGCIWTDMGDH